MFKSPGFKSLWMKAPCLQSHPKPLMKLYEPRALMWDFTVFYCKVPPNSSLGHVLDHSNVYCKFLELLIGTLSK